MPIGEPPRDAAAKTRLARQEAAEALEGLPGMGVAARLPTVASVLREGPPILASLVLFNRSCLRRSSICLLRLSKSEVNRVATERQQRYALCHSDAFASTSCATASASVPDACRAPRTVFIFSTLVSITNREVRLNARPTCLGVAHSSAGTTSP